MNRQIVYVLLAIGLLAFLKKKKKYKIIVPDPEKITRDEFYK